MLRDMQTRPPSRRVFGMFPGLRDHYVNMARGLYDGEQGFRQVVDRCCELLVPEVGLDLRTVIYPTGNRSSTGFLLDAAGLPSAR
jgi:acyl transferase domain-containing protein